MAISIFNLALFGGFHSVGFVDVLVGQPNIGCGSKILLGKFALVTDRRGDLTPILSRVILICETALGEAFDLECAKDALSDEANYWTIFAR